MASGNGPVSAAMSASDMGSGWPGAGEGDGTAIGSRGPTGTVTLLQAQSIPTIAAVTSPLQPRHTIAFMALILLEALAALVILIAIVWWTMFSGRKNGELPDQDDRPTDRSGKD